MKVQKAFCLFALLAATLACSLSTPPVAEPHSSTPVPSLVEFKSEISNQSSPTPERENPSTPLPTTCIVGAQALNLRDCAGVACKVIAWLHIQDQLTVLGTDHNWLKVQTPDGQTGWVNGKYCGGQP